MSEAQSPDFRIGDTEREAAIKALGEHFSAGRLDIDEYGDRSAKVTTARTRSELTELFADLPAPKPTFDTPVPAVQPQATAEVTKRWRGIPGEIAGPIIGVSWLAAIVLGSTFHIPYLIFAAIAVSMVFGSAGRWHDKERRRGIRHELRARRRELGRGE